LNLKNKYNISKPLIRSDNFWIDDFRINLLIPFENKKEKAHNKILLKRRITSKRIQTHTKK